MLHRIDAGDARAVHRTRVGSRRLRELLPVLQLDAGTTRKLQRRLRRITRRLGDVRELDVMAAHVASLRARGTLDERALRLLGDRIEAARQEALGQLAKNPLARELTRARHKLSQLKERLPRDEPGNARRQGWRWALEARVAHRAARLVETIDAAGAVYLPERLHAVRIALKKLRYAVELWVEAAGERTSADLRVLKRSQQTLGKMHDAQVLLDFVRRVQATHTSSDTPTQQGLNRVARALEESCRRLHARQMRERGPLLEVAERLGRSAAGDRSARRAG